MKLYNNKQIGKYLTLETKDVDKSQNNLIDCLYFADIRYFGRRNNFKIFYDEFLH